VPRLVQLGERQSPVCPRCDRRHRAPALVARPGSDSGGEGNILVIGNLNPAVITPGATTTAHSYRHLFGVPAGYLSAIAANLIDAPADSRDDA
jgi:hypothetical protein